MRNDECLPSKTGDESPVVYRQMEYDLEGCLHGICFAGAGALCCAAAVAMLCGAEPMGLFAGVMGTLFIAMGYPLIACYMARVKITREDVCLTLGPIVLQKMAISEVQTVAYSALTPNIRGNPWTTEVIVISHHSSSQMRYYARRWVRDEDLPAGLSPDEKEQLILKKSVEKYLRAYMRSFHLTYDAGIWLECLSEREERLKELFPNAECFLE